MKTRGLSHWRRLCRDCGLLPPADGANHAQDIEFTIGAAAIQQRSVGLHKQRRRDSSDARFMLTKESEHGRTARALFGDPPGKGGDRLPGALRLTSCYGLLREKKSRVFKVTSKRIQLANFLGRTGDSYVTIRRGLLLRRREDRERSVCIRAGAIPHRTVEAARMGEPLRELLAQTSTITLYRARA